jgi:hypothetical protein
MQLLRTSTLLRRVLLADAATCFALGLLMILRPGVLEQFLGLPAGLLRYAGISLIPFAAFVVYLAVREGLSQLMVWTVIVLNLLWAADSLVLLVSGWVDPTELGYAVVIAQALGVAVFAGLEYLGMKKSATTEVVTA